MIKYQYHLLIKNIRFSCKGMNFEWKEIAKVAAIGVLAATLFKQILHHLELIRKKNQCQEWEVQDLQDLVGQLQQKGKASDHVPYKEYLVKLVPYYFEPIRNQKELHVNHQSFQPSLDNLVEKVRKQIHEDGVLCNKKGGVSKYQWFASKYQKQQHLGKQNHRSFFDKCWDFFRSGNQQKVKQQNCMKLKEVPIKVLGFGCLFQDIFSIKKEYEPYKLDQNWYWGLKIFCSRLLNIFNISRRTNNLEFNKQEPLFLGSVIGVLRYEVGLLKDTNLIAVCKIEDGKIIPSITAHSKHEILHYYDRMISNSYLKVGVALIVTILMGRWLLKDIKRYLNILKVRRQKNNKKKYFNPDNIEDDKLCIICYASCRNMVFFDCRHVIMCQECSETYQEDICPYCKMEIDQIRMIQNCER